MNDWVCTRCSSINRASAEHCYSCGSSKAVAAATPVAAANPIATTTGVAAMAGLPMPGVPLAVGPDGGSMPLAGEAVPPPPAPGTAAGPMDLVGGLVAGAVAAILASAVWYLVVSVSQFQVGLVAVAVGWLVGQGVVYGAQRRFSVALIPISVVLTLLALTVSEYLIVAHLISEEIGLAVELVQPPSFIVEIVTASLQADPLTLVFWAIALFQAFVIPARVPRPSAA